MLASDGETRTLPEFIEFLAEGGGNATDRQFAARVLRERFGYSMGTLNGTNAEMQGPAMADLSDWKQRTSDFGEYGPAAAAEKFLAVNTSDPNQNVERLALFTTGEITRLGRTVAFKFTDDVADLAASKGVSREEALAKTEWRTYQAAVEAAFSVPAVKSITINGAWRPPPSLSSPLTGHYGGLGLDFVYVNGDSINNVQNNHPQPATVRDFAVNLSTEGGPGTQIIQPWMTENTYAASTVRPALGNGFVANARVTALELQHLNHLHFGMH